MRRARLQREERILRQEAWELCALFDVNFQPTCMSVAELERGLRDLAAKLYDADATRERRNGFRRRVAAARRAAKNAGHEGQGEVGRSILILPA